MSQRKYKKEDISRLTTWVKGVFYVYNEGKSKQDRIDKTADECRKIATLLFEPLYCSNDRRFFWSEEEFNKWHNNSNEIVCFYCGCSSNEVEKFYDYVESDRGRGRNFEIDRMHGRMKTYLPKEKRSEFVEWAKKVVVEITDETLSDLRLALDDFDYLYLPAPYNANNCVFACYWCNNAKTDAFTDEEFMPIGKAIGVAIKEILRKNEVDNNAN